MDEIKHSSSGKVQEYADSKKLEAKTRSIKGLSDKALKKKIEEMYPEIFNELGKLTEEHLIHIKENATPVIYPTRKIPVALEDRLKKELDTIERNGVIKRIEEPTDWVNSLVLVEKPDGSLGICLDPRDLNKAIKREHYQLPKFDEIASRLTGATRFTKLDANKGYCQIPLDEQSSKLTTTSTPYGRYCFLRLPCGLHSAQEIFHKRISQKFEAMDGTETDIDNFLIQGKDDNENDKRLIQCLEKARKIGLTLNSSKCQFRCDEMTYLGHTISKDGINADANKIRAITEMPMSEDKKSVQRLLGMINYVGKFILNL